jgi:hypothetical protein
MKAEDFIVIKDMKTGKFFSEKDSGDGPGPYTIYSWVDIQEATRYTIWEVSDKGDHLEKMPAQDVIHPDRFKMPATACTVRIRVTETIEVIKWH